MICNVGLAENPTSWQTLSKGLEYTKLSGFQNFPAGQVHAFKIDLQHYHLKVLPLPSDTSLFSTQSFQQLMSAQGAVVASNAGFFTPELTPLGLRVSSSKTLSPLKAVSWWSVFYIQDKTPHLVRQQHYKPTPSVEFAVEAGPLLIAEGKIVPASNQKIDSRTAIGITKDGKILLVATENLLLSVADLAEAMQRSREAGGLDCVNAMNLDGGHSTQIYATLAKFSLEVPSSARVADAILVVP